MNFSKEVIALLDEIAKRLQIPFEQAMRIAQNQLNFMLIMDWVWIIGAVISLIIFVCFCVSYKKQCDKRGGFFYENDEVAGAICIIGGLSVITLIICALFCGVEILQVVISPDWVIIKIIRRMVGM